MASFLERSKDADLGFLRIHACGMAKSSWLSLRALLGGYGCVR